MRLEQENTSILLWWIIGGIVVLVGLYVAYAQFFANSAPPQTAPPAQMAKAAPVTPAAQVQVSSATTTPAASEPLALVDENILKAPVAEDATMAKDEIAKLDDVQKQLTDQESTLTQQHQDADALIQLKEEQIKMLEAQLAQQTDS